MVFNNGAMVPFKKMQAISRKTKSKKAKKLVREEVNTEDQVIQPELEPEVIRISYEEEQVDFEVNPEVDWSALKVFDSEEQLVSVNETPVVPCYVSEKSFGEYPETVDPVEEEDKITDADLEEIIAPKAKPKRRRGRRKKSTVTSSQE